MNIVLLAAEDGHRTLAQLVDVASNPLVWVTALTIIGIPLLNAALTRANSSKLFKAILTAVLAGVYAVIAYLTNLGDVGIDWPGVLVVFVTAAAGAGGINAAVVGGPIANKLGNVVPINVGPAVPTPEAAHLAHSGHEPTMPTPDGVPESVGVDDYEAQFNQLKSS